MRIALTSSFFRPKTSGSAHFTSGLAAELAKQGHDVLVVTCTPNPDGDDDLPYRTVRLPAVNLNLGRFSYGYEIPFCPPRAVRRLWRELDRFAPDVLHLNEQFFDLSVWAGLWGRRHAVPRVMTLHTAFTHNVPWIHALLRAVDATVVSSTLALNDPTLVTIDKFMTQYATRRFPRRRREFVPIPVEPDVFVGGDPRRVRDHLGLAERPVILSLGHVIPLRDRLLLVRALPEVLRRVPDAVLVVVGRVYDTRFLELADELGVRDAIVADGEVPHDQVKDYVAAATVECHETQSYGLGTASLEIMASGLAVVAVVDDDNFPGFRLADGRELAIARPDPSDLASHLIDLLGDDARRMSVAAGGRCLILDHFQISSVADAYVSLYERAGNA
jgi:glycosyltransferase involved in cell wall biosynthesis